MARSKCRTMGCMSLSEHQGYCSAHIPTTLTVKRERNHRDLGYHNAYNSSRWKARRNYELNRHPLCEACLRVGLTTGATDVDHIIPHKGDVNLFYHGDLQCLCQRCHSIKTQAESLGKIYDYRNDRVLNLDGLPWPPG